MISRGNHVKFARFVLLVVSEEAKTLLKFFSVQCIVKQLLDSVFVISSWNNQGLGKGYQLKPKASTLIILDIRKLHPIIL